MLFQLRELAIPIAGDSAQGAWPELGSTCRKGGSTCVAREPVMPEVTTGMPALLRSASPRFHSEVSMAGTKTPS